MPAKDLTSSSSNLIFVSQNIPASLTSGLVQSTKPEIYSKPEISTFPTENKPSSLPSVSDLSASSKVATPGGPPVIVYSMTLSALTVPTLTVAGLASKPEISNLITTVSPSKKSVFPSSPSLTVLSTLSVSTKLEFPGYEIVPSPSSISGLPNKDKILEKTSSTIPVWTQELLGNAYGGGFIATPSLYVTKLPYPSAPSEGVPPGYGDSKLGVVIVAVSNLQISGGKDNKTTILVGGSTPSFNSSTDKTENPDKIATVSGLESSLSTIYLGGPEVTLTVLSGSPILLPSGTDYKYKSSQQVFPIVTTVASSSLDTGPKNKPGGSGQAPYSYAFPPSPTSETLLFSIGSPSTVTYSISAPLANSTGHTVSKNSGTFPVYSSSKSENGAQATKRPSTFISPLVATESSELKPTSMASSNVGLSASEGDVNTGASLVAGFIGSSTSLGIGLKDKPTGSKVTGPSTPGIGLSSSPGALIGAGQPSKSYSPVFASSVVPITSGSSSKKDTNSVFTATNNLASSLRTSKETGSLKYASSLLFGPLATSAPTVNGLSTGTDKLGLPVPTQLGTSGTKLSDSSAAVPVIASGGALPEVSLSSGKSVISDKGPIIAPSPISVSTRVTDNTAALLTTQAVDIVHQVPSGTPAVGGPVIFSVSSVVSNPTATLISPAAANAGSSGPSVAESSVETSAAFIAGISPTVTVGGISTTASTTVTGSGNTGSPVLSAEVSKTNQAGSTVITGTNASLAPTLNEQISGAKQRVGGESTPHGGIYGSSTGSPQAANSLLSDKSKPAYGGLPVSTFSTGGPGVQGGLPTPQGPIYSAGTQVGVSSGLYTSANSSSIGNSSVSVLLNPTAISRFQGSAIRLSLSFGVGLIGVILFLVIL